MKKMIIAIMFAVSSLQIVACQSDRDAAFVKMMKERAHEKSIRDEQFLLEKYKNGDIKLLREEAFCKKRFRDDMPATPRLDSLKDVPFVPEMKLPPTLALGLEVMQSFGEAI